MSERAIGYFQQEETAAMDRAHALGYHLPNRV
jgi:hypothetical protein